MGGECRDSWKWQLDNLRDTKQRHYFANKGLSSQGYSFSSGQVWMWELDYKESWALKNWCFWTVVLEKTLESPLECKKIHPVHPKGDQSQVFTGRTDVEAETPILWPPHAKSWHIVKDPDAGKDWGQEEMGMREDEMVGWHHRLNGHGFGWTPEVGNGQGGLARCGSWGRKELDMTKQLNWTENSSETPILINQHETGIKYNGHNNSGYYNTKPLWSTWNFIHSAFMYWILSLPQVYALKIRFRTVIFTLAKVKMATLSHIDYFLGFAM